MRRRMIALSYVIIVLIAAVPGRAQENPSPSAQTRLQPKFALPVEPVSAIVTAFRSHAVVALGNVEFRGNEQAHTFQVSLIRDPRFTAVANDILVEFGNSRYQDLVDRFMRGEDIAYDLLRRVWQNTTQVEYEW